MPWPIPFVWLVWRLGKYDARDAQGHPLPPGAPASAGGWPIVLSTPAFLGPKSWAWASVNAGGTDLGGGLTEWRWFCQPAVGP